jgi:hypothetical protein
LPSLVNLLFFKGVWLGSLIGAGSGRPWLGLLLLSGFLVWHLFHSEHRRVDLYLLAAAGVTGLVLDTLFLQLGVLNYAHPLPSADLAPFWIVLMWMNFALTLNLSMRWLQGRYWLAAAMGLAGGPLAYIAGVELGAAQWAMTTGSALLVIGLAWSLAVPLLAGFAHRLMSRPAAIPA